MIFALDFQVIPNKALENSGRRVPFPINIVCKGNNDESLPAPQDPTELLQLGMSMPAFSLSHVHSGALVNDHMSICYDSYTRGSVIYPGVASASVRSTAFWLVRS